MDFKDELHVLTHQEWMCAKTLHSDLNFKLKK